MQTVVLPRRPSQRRAWLLVLPLLTVVYLAVLHPILRRYSALFFLPQPLKTLPLDEAGAQALLAKSKLFPLRHQVDVAVSQLPWGRGARFAIDPEGVLLTSPKSEEGQCDTDIQCLGHPSEMAHAQLPRTMMRL